VTQSAPDQRDKADADLTFGRLEPSVPVFLMTDSLETGGSERQFAALAASLDPVRFRSQLGCLQKRGSFLEGLGDIAEFPLGGNLYGVRSMRERLRLARHLRESQTAVAHAFDFYTNLVLIPAARVARVPVVIGSQRQLGDLLTPAQRFVQATVFGWCDAVVCNSHAAARRLIEQGLPESRVVIIGNGLPPSAFAPAIPALPRRGGLLRVGMIARMNTQSKNHLTLLRAAARLCIRFPEIEFVFAGDGPLRPELERRTRDLGISDRVLFLGDRRDIPAILASIDISVLPSASESLSNVILESMAAGVPVVASRVGGNEELLTDGRGVLVALDDEPGLGNAMERLLRDAALRSELGGNGRRFAESGFTIAQMRQRHEELYRELLTEKMRRKPGRVFFSQSKGRNGSIELRSIKPRPIHVAIVAASPRYVGGHSVQAGLLIANWKNDPAISACMIPIDPPFPRGLKWAEKVPVVRTLIREPIYLVSLWRGLEHADIAHIFSASYWAFLIAPAPAWFIARLRGKKTLIHYHSGEARDHLRRSGIARSVLRRADVLVVPSGYLVDVLDEFALAADAVPNIIDLSQFHFRARRVLRPHLVCTRGFHPYYCGELVVEAFALVQREFPHARLDLIGKGPQESKIRSMVKQLGLNHVSFPGVVSRQEIGQCYDSADIFINASNLDNMPVSILEAFASGTPVVTTAPEGIRHLVEHERTGLLSKPGDARALADHVIRLLGDAELSFQIACHAYEQSLRYRWTAVREQWLERYLLLHGQECAASQGLVRVA
jgi:glycosyltransferase involved in cell wall biosynthesis